MENNFYVYEWYNIDTQEVFYVGKGSGKRYQSTQGRNTLFQEYIKNNKTDVRIVYDNLTEEEAFQKELELYEKYYQIGQSQCNLAKPGKGGCHFVWTEEMKEYWSENNPMKEEKQRQRMRENNPMKNKEIAMKNGQAHKIAVIIGNKEYDGLIDAAKQYNTTPQTISNWCKKGINPQGEKCQYKNNTTRKGKEGKAVEIDGKFYPTIAAAAQAIGVASSSLGSALRKGQTTCKGHSCKYANQQPSQ